MQREIKLPWLNELQYLWLFCFPVFAFPVFLDRTPFEGENWITIISILLYFVFLGGMSAWWILEFVTSYFLQINGEKIGIKKKRGRRTWPIQPITIISVGEKRVYLYDGKRGVSIRQKKLPDDVVAYLRDRVGEVDGVAG